MIEQRFKESIDRYIEQGIPTGGFLTAVLENNLREAIGRADTEALENLKDIVQYLYWKVPGIAWGSKERVAEWHQKFNQDNPDL